MILLSIVIPTFNEIKFAFLERNLKKLEHLENIEVICVDSHSTDGTAELIMNYNVIYLLSQANTRAERLNQGVVRAKGEMILLHHPRSEIDLAGILYLRDNFFQLWWGGFYHRFDKEGLGLKFTSYYSNRIRAKVCSNLYLDHCIFFRRELFLKNGVFLENEIIPISSIFEDTLLSYKLRKLAFMKLLPYYSVTSSVRFDRNGFMKQAILNQIMKLMFYFNVPDHFMNSIYEKNLFLNSKY